MADTQPQPSMPRRAATNALKVALVLGIVACGVQTGMAYLDRSSEQIPEQNPNPETELGGWTFSGEGLAVSVKTVEAENLVSELSAPGTSTADWPAQAEGETRLLELLATLGDGEPLADGRRRWRHSISGIEAYAETQRTPAGDRLVVARAAFAGASEGMTLLEIRPSAAGNGNGRGAGEGFALCDGATEIARRVSPTGETTGTLLMTPLPLDDAMSAAKRSLSAKGWSVEEGAAGEDASAKTCSCRRDAERMQVVVFRDGGTEQTMILGVRE